MRKMTIIALFTAGLVGLGSPPARGNIFEARQPFQLTVDICRFRGGDDAHAMLEIYYAFPRTSIFYASDSSGWSGAVDITLLIHDGDSLVHADRWLVPQSLPDTSDLTGAINLVGNYLVQLPAANYAVRLIGRDRLRSDRVDSVSYAVPVAPIGNGTPQLSDIEFASVIRRGERGSQFYKNTLEVIPNPGGIYAEKQQVYFYAEAYNLQPSGQPEDYYLRSSVFDAVGKEIVSRERPKRDVGESSVLVDQFPVDKFKSGTYTLVLALLDTGRTVLSSIGKKFFVYNETMGIDSTLLAGAAGLPLNVYMTMSEEELDQEFAWCKYESTSEEKDQYAELTGVEAKRTFMTDFWRKRPAGLRDEYLSRVAYANRNLRAGMRDGYLSDRGRVRIIYGEPDDIDRHPSETDRRPYEIWMYHNIQGGVIFVFVQRNVGGDYELVHSTHRNELRDDNWDRPGITY
jgi:GWxTD domain-containing protein